MVADYFGNVGSCSGQQQAAVVESDHSYIGDGGGGKGDIHGNLNYLDAKDDTTNEYLDDRAKFSTSFEIQRSLGKLGINADIQAESGRHDLSGTSLKGHAIAGIGLQYRFNRQVEISSRIDNLWDEKYTVNLISAQDEFRSYGRIALFKIKLRL